MLVLDALMALVREGSDDRDIKDLRRDVKEHAVSLAVSKALTLSISFARGGAGSPSVLGAGGIKVVSGSVLGVSDDAAACAGGSTATQSRQEQRVWSLCYLRWRWRRRGRLRGRGRWLEASQHALLKHSGIYLTLGVDVGGLGVELGAEGGYSVVQTVVLVVTVSRVV